MILFARLGEGWSWVLRIVACQCMKAAEGPLDGPRLVVQRLERVGGTEHD
ncbi:MAG: hypothetical protein JWM89_3845 [Acidimicrobiales bacterium]|nr:hypothetical protein [Acidimicrobiales bacterium]